MASSEMLRRVALVRTDVSKEISASLMVEALSSLQDVIGYRKSGMQNKCKGTD
jgi:hypothetical protein